MQEYRLSRWPALPSAYDRTVYRRLLHSMSQQYVTLQHLASLSSLPRTQLLPFLSYLQAQGVLQERTSLFQIEQSDHLPLRTLLRAWMYRARAHLLPLGVLLGTAALGLGAILGWS